MKTKTYTKNKKKTKNDEWEKSGLNCTPDAVLANPPFEPTPAPLSPDAPPCVPAPETNPATETEAANE